MYMDRFNRPSYGPYGEPPGQNGLYVNPYQPYRLPTERNPGTDPTVADPVIQDPYSSGVRPATGHNPGGANTATDSSPQQDRPWWANPMYLYAGMGGLRYGMPAPYQMGGGYSAPSSTPSQTSNSYFSTQGGSQGSYSQPGSGSMPSSSYSQPMSQLVQGSYGGGGTIGGYGGGGTMGSYSSRGSQGRRNDGYGGITGGFMGGRY